MDLFQIEGVGFNFVLTLLSEVGMNLSNFPTSKHFTSWLSLSPNKKVTGGKVISSRTKRNKSRLKQAFKQAAIGASKKRDTALSHFYRRIAAKHGKGTAITATARKIATIVYTMLKNGEPYQPQGLKKYQENVRIQRIKRIQRTIEKLEVKKDELAFA